MGFIKAFSGALSGTFADQWLDFYGPQQGVPSTALFFSAEKQGPNAGRGENSKGSENIITNGSKIIVPTGMALVTIQDGAITGVITEPGGYEFKSDDPNSRSLFSGDGIISSTICQSWERFKFGGQPGTQQLAFYINLQEVTGNTFGTATPVVWDDAFLQTQVSAIVRGTYGIQIQDPILFVTQFLPVQYKVAGASLFDIADVTNEKSDSLFNDFISALPEAFGEYCNDSQGGARFAQIQRDQSGMGQVLAKKVEEKYQWLSKYGLTITKVSVIALEYDEQSAELVKQAQGDDIDLRKEVRRGQAFSNNMAGMMAAANADSMLKAAGNENGSMMGFMGMNMANMQANNLMASAVSANQTQQTQTQAQDPTTKLLEMKKLLDAGAITQEEYDTVKKQVLGL